MIEVHSRGTHTNKYTYLGYGLEGGVAVDEESSDCGLDDIREGLGHVHQSIGVQRVVLDGFHELFNLCAISWKFPQACQQQDAVLWIRANLDIPY